MMRLGPRMDHSLKHLDWGHSVVPITRLISTTIQAYP